MTKKTQIDILDILRIKYPHIYRESQQLPKSYCKDPANVKAIILGCDPGTKQKKNFEFVFDIDGDKRYFGNIEKNLSELDISIDEVYVDNLCRNYFTVETSKNKEWIDVAELWIPFMKEILDNKFHKNIPVLVTSEVLLKVLSKDKIKKPKFYYENNEVIKNNKLDRILIPFFRHYDYTLDKHENYKHYIKKFITQN